MGSAATPLYAPSTRVVTDEPLPHVDERLARPGVWEEVRDGVVYQLTPADEKHGDAHHHVAAVVGAVVRDEYKVSIDRLTRTSKTTDFAPDVTICPREKTPDGHSKIAEVAIEIADSQSRSDVRWKAEKLIERGCRRVFLLDCSANVVCEFDIESNDWAELAPETMIVDKTFLTPVKAAQLIEQIRHDSLVIEAYRLVGAPALRALEESARAKGEAEGKIEGKIEGRIEAARRMLNLLLAARFSVDQDARVNACDSIETLERWATRVLIATSVEAVFRD